MRPDQMPTEPLSRALRFPAGGAAATALILARD